MCASAHYPSKIEAIEPGEIVPWQLTRWFYIPKSIEIYLKGKVVHHIWNFVISDHLEASGGYTILGDNLFDNERNAGRIELLHRCYFVK